MHVSRETERELRALLQPKEQSELPTGAGVAVAVLQDSEVVHQACFGPRDPASGEPVTARSRFAIASITKTITATLSMLLHEEGRLDLDAPLNAEEALLPLANASASAAVSLRDVLSHRTGLPAHDLLWLLDRFSPSELRERLSFLEPIPEGFRKTFVYNNLTFSLVGAVLEAKTGQRFEALVEERLLRPLGMSDSGFSTAPARGLDFALSRELPFRDTTHIAPAGGLVSTLEDLTKWLRFARRRGVAPDGRRLLSEAAFEQLWTPQISLEPPFPDFMHGWEWTGPNLSYGLGHILGEAWGDSVVFHMGVIDGYSTGVALMPGAGTGVVVLTSAHASPAPGRIARDVLATLLRRTLVEEAAPPATAPAPAPRDSQRGDAALASLEGLEGTYADPAYGELELELAEAGVAIRYRGQRWPVRMISADAGAFEIPVFGITIPLELTIDREAKTISIPFAMDPRVGSRRFVRVSR